MSPITRRRLLAGVGTAAAACCAAGCSTYGTPRAAAPAGTGAAPEPAAPVPSAEPQAAAEQGAEQGLAAASDIPVGGGRVFAEDGVVVTQPQAGTFAAFDATCPHAGCLVDQVTATGISCPCHGSVFDIDGGVPLEGPAGAPLAARPVRVENDRIVLA